MRRFRWRPDRELGQNFLVDSNILGVAGRLAELSDAGRGARDRRRAGGALGVPRRAHRARARGRARRTAAGAPGGRGRALCERHPALGRRAGGGPRGDAPRPHEGGRQPPLRCRRRRAAAHDRGAAHGDPLGGDGAARGRRAAGCRTGWPGLRGALSARPARVRGARRAHGPPHGLSPRTQRGLRARRVGSHRASLHPSRCAGSWGQRSPTGARRWRARWRWRGWGPVASRCARRCSSWGTPRTCAPSGWPRASSWRWRRRWV